MTLFARWLVILGAFSLLGRGDRPIIDQTSDPPIEPGQPGFDTTVQVRSLGVAGFMIRLGDDVLLTAPLYSDPPLLDQALLPVFPNLGRITAAHPSIPDVKAILVGHAHYDHLMDVPYVWARTPNAIIYGTQTTKNVLAAYRVPQSHVPGFPDPVPTIPEDHIRALNAKIDTRNCAGRDPSEKAPPEARCPLYPAQDGDWEMVTPTLRIRALCARHPPQLLCFHQSPGCQNAPLDHLPATRHDYLEGEPLVYLIDFLGPGGHPIFRVYFQDVPSDGQFGRVPEALFQGQRRVDLAILCAGSWRQGPGNDAQEIVRNLRPRHVVLGHWENFFHAQDERLEPAPLQDVAKFQKLVRRELDGLHCPETPTLIVPKPQLLKRYPVTAASCD